MMLFAEGGDECSIALRVFACFTEPVQGEEDIYACIAGVLSVALSCCCATEESLTVS